MRLELQVSFVGPIGQPSRASGSLKPPVSDVLFASWGIFVELQVARRHLPVLHFAELDVFGGVFSMRLELQAGLVGPIGSSQASPRPSFCGI